MTSPASSVPSFSNWIVGTGSVPPPPPPRTVGCVDPLGGRLDRDVVGERVGDDHDAPGVQREVARQSHERFGERRDLRPGTPQRQRSKVRVRREQRGQWAAVRPRQPLGQRRDLRCGTAVDLGHLPQRRLALEGDVVRHHRRAPGSVLPEHVLQRPVALIPGKVEVGVGGVAAAGIEEALEHQPLRERVHVREPETVAHDRIGDAAPAAVRGRVGDDVPDHQEIVGVVLGCDDGQLVLDPLADHWRQYLGTIATARPQHGELTQLGEGLRTGECGQDHPTVGRAAAAALGQVHRVAQRLRAIGEQPRHLRPRLEPRVPRREGVGGQSRERRIVTDGRQQPMARVVLRMGEPHRVRGDRRQPVATRERPGGFPPAPRHQLDVEVLGARFPRQPIEEGDVAR